MLFLIISEWIKLFQLGRDIIRPNPDRRNPRNIDYRIPIETHNISNQSSSSRLFNEQGPTTGMSTVDVAAETEPPLGESTARFWCPELTQEGQWHHLTLILNRAAFKNSTVIGNGKEVVNG